MGFGRSRKNNWKKYDSRKGRARPRLALAGAITLAIGILLIFYVIDIRKSDYSSLIAILAVMAGTLMLLFSMSKRNQMRFVKGVDTAREMFKAECQCCKCQNCGRNHNHWTHD